MGKCAKCGAAAHLYENGTPRCFKCSEAIEAARKQTARAIVAQRELPVTNPAVA
jgi:hypothetical protein